MLLAIAGVVGVIGACLLPFLHFSKAQGGGSPSILLTGAPYAQLWFAAEPVAVAIAALAAGIVLLASSSPGPRWATAGMLLAFGIQTPLLFAGYLFGITLSPGSHHGPAGPVGILAGLLLLAAGILGLVGAAAGQRAATQKDGPAAQGGTLTTA